MTNIAVWESRIVRRSYLNVPSSDRHKLKESLRSKSDVIVYSLQEGIFNPSGKCARENLHKLLSSSRSPNQVSLPKPSRVAVRISSVRSPDFVEDVKILKEHGGGISCVILSNITSANDVRTAVKVIRDRIQMHRVRLIVSIECAHGVKNIKEILAFCHKNNFHFFLSGILFDADSYCNNSSKIRAPSALELEYARTKIALLAKEYEIGAIDTVSSVNVSRRQLWRECLQARGFGFSGKQATNPKQVEAIKRAYGQRQTNSSSNDSGVDKEEIIETVAEFDYEEAKETFKELTEWLWE